MSNTDNNPSEPRTAADLARMVETLALSVEARQHAFVAESVMRMLAHARPVASQYATSQEARAAETGWGLAVMDAALALAETHPEGWSQDREWAYRDIAFGDNPPDCAYGGGE